MTRVVQVLPDVSAIDRVFDYEVIERDDPRVRIGSIVRIDLHGRRVRGWVVAEGAGAAGDVVLKAIAKVSPGHVPADLVDLSSWAAWRWAGKRRSFLATASQPQPVVTFGRGAPKSDDRLGDLEARVAKLEAEIAELREQLGG